MERSNRNLWIGLGILAVVLLLMLPAWGGGGMMGRGFVGPGPFGDRAFPGAWGWGFWGIGLFARLLFFGLIFYLVVRLFRGRRFGGYRDRYYDDEVRRTDLPPAEILRRRYAAGEITREQYEEMLRTVEPSTT